MSIGYKYVNKNLELRDWNDLIEEYGEYKSHIDAGVLVSHGLYNYTKKNMAILTDIEIEECHGVYHIYMAGVFYFIPKEFFIEVGKHE